jgi:hypothetical protein
VVAAPFRLEEEEGTRFLAMPCQSTAALRLQREGVVVTAVRSFMDSTGPISVVLERRDDTGKYLVRLAWWRPRPRVLFPSLEGVVEMSRHLAHSLGLGCCLWVKASIRSRIGMMAASSMLYLCLEHHA